MNVLLVEDHNVVREGIRMLLETGNGLRVVGEASSLGDALASDADPDVVLADLVLGDADGSEVVEALHKRFPEARILVLTMVDNPTDIRRAFGAGADGYLLKDAAGEDLIEAVHRVAAGESYLQPSLGVSLAQTAGSGSGSRVGTHEVLSPRETQVLKLLAIGHTNAEIAETLGVAVRTIEAHRASLQSKLGIKTRAEIVRYASRVGLVELTADG